MTLFHHVLVMTAVAVAVTAVLGSLASQPTIPHLLAVLGLLWSLGGMLLLRVHPRR